MNVIREQIVGTANWILIRGSLFVLRLNRLLLRTIRAANSSAGKSLLREFLLTDHTTRRQFLARFSTEVFDGVHPKNIFHYRHEFFLDNVEKDEVVVDIACGTGKILFEISKSIEKGIGIDIDSRNLDICKNRHNAPNLKFIEADVLNVDYAKMVCAEGITTAILSHILEHIDDVPLFLAQLNISKLLICVPSVENWLCQLRIYLGLPYLTDSTHYREYSRDMLVTHLSSAGYRIRSMGFNSEGEITCLAEMD